MLSMRYFGDPILRKRAKIVEKVDEETRQIVADMAEIMKQYRGIGLAAPQVGLSIRLFISRIEKESEETKISADNLLVFINPRLSEASAKEDVMKEGCLSLPGIHEEVWRPEEITVEALDIHGKLFKKRFSGLQARCIMHENDHINGTLFIDRITMRARTHIEHLLRAIKKKYK